MTALLASIAGVSLVVGGIGIMNIMLVSVTERTREIGIRKTVGARRQDIFLQFLCEAVTLSVLGGLLGIGLAFLLSLVADRRAAHAADFPFKPGSFFHFDWWMLGLGLGVSIVFCVLGGLLPAWRAARIPPAQALTQQ